MAGTPSDNPEEAHTDLMALIKAGRDLPPDMDKALAESFMEKHKLASQGGSQQTVVAQTGQQTPEAVNSVAGAVISMVGIAAYIVALIVSQGHLWWIIFPLMAFGFGGWRGYGHSHDEHRRMHDERHLAREQWRHQRYMARMGYPPQQPHQPQQLPESTSKWEPPTPPMQRPTPPSASSASTTGSDTPPVNPAG